MTIIIILGISFGLIHISNSNIPLLDKSNSHVQDTLTEKFRGEIFLNHVFGESGNGNDNFSNPLGMDVFNGQIFVADTQNKRIQILTKDGEFISRFFVDGEKIEGIAVTDEIIFIVDTDSSKVLSYTHDGEKINEFPISWSRDLEADEEFVYVLEPHKKQVRVYLHTGEFKYSIPVHENVHYVNTDNETLIVSGPHSSVSIAPEVIIIDKNTKIIKSRFNTSYEVSGVDVLGNYVFLIEGDLIKILDTHGKILAQYGELDQKKETRGTQIEINNNQIFVLDTWNDQIQVFNFRMM